MRPAGRADQLVALGTSVETSCHLLLRQHVLGALDRGLVVGQVRSAVKMAEIVQQHAAEITAPAGRPHAVTIARTIAADRRSSPH